MKVKYLIQFVCSIVLFASTAFVSHAQLRTAYKLYDKKKYEQAIPHFEKYIEKTKDVVAMQKLAECYRLEMKYAQAEKLYEQLVNMQGSEPINLFYYGLVLKYNQKYDEAKKQLDKFLQYNQANKEGAEIHLRSIEELRTITKSLPQFEVKAVKEINSVRSEFSPVMYNNGLVFVSERNGDLVNFDQSTATSQPYYNLYYSKIIVEKKLSGSSNVISNTANVNIAKELEEVVYGRPSFFSNKLNSKYNEGPLTFSADGNWIYFTRSEFNTLSGVNTTGIYYSEKRNGKWITPRPFKFNNPAYSVAHPCLSADGEWLYFASDMPGGSGGMDLYVCKKNGTVWLDPKNLGAEVNTIGNEVFPYLRKDAELYFSSDGHPGFGKLDVFSTTNKTGKWSKPQSLGLHINSTEDDFGICFKSDNKSGYFSSNRPGGLGADDIYSFVESNKFISISGKILLSQSVGDPAKGLKVVLIKEDGSVVSVTTTDQTGYFLFQNILPDQKYIVKIDEQDPDFIFSKHFYLTDDKNNIIRTAIINDLGYVFVFESLPSGGEGKLKFLNSEDPELVIAGNLLSGEKEEVPLTDAQIDLVDDNGKVIKTISTNALGGFVFSGLQQNRKYTLKLNQNSAKLNSKAKVVLTNKDGKVIMSTILDENGLFYFSLLPAEKKALELLAVDETELKVNVRGILATGDGKQKRLSELKVFLYNNKGELINTILADAEGRFAFYNLPADESYVIMLDEKDTRLKDISRILILNEKGNVIKTIERDVKGYFRFRKLPLDYSSNQLTTMYVDDPWLQVTNFSGKKLKKDTITIIENIYYDYGEAKLLPAAMLTLNKVINVMKANPLVNIEISAHTDSRSGDDFNKQLSQKRANAAMKYMIEKGVDTKRLKAVGYGESKLINRCSNGVVCSEEEHALNRRTEFKIVQIK